MTLGAKGLKPYEPAQLCPSYRCPFIPASIGKNHVRLLSIRFAQKN